MDREGSGTELFVNEAFARLDFKLPAVPSAPDELALPLALLSGFQAVVLR